MTLEVIWVKWTHSHVKETSLKWFELGDMVFYPSGSGHLMLNTHKGINMVNNNTQVGCGIWRMWNSRFQSLPRKYPPHHYTATGLNCLIWVDGSILLGCLHQILILLFCVNCSLIFLFLADRRDTWCGHVRSFSRSALNVYSTKIHCGVLQCDVMSSKCQAKSPEHILLLLILIFIYLFVHLEWCNHKDNIL